MTKNDINLVIEILSDKADEFQKQIDYLRNVDENLTLRINNVLSSNLSDDDKTDVKNFLVQFQWENAADIVELDVKLRSLDSFISELHDLFKYDNQDYIIFNLESND